MIRHALLGAASALLVCAIAPASLAQDLPQTPAEARGWDHTSTSAEVVEYLNTIALSSPNARRVWLGKTNEGREIAGITFADPPVNTAQQAREDERPVVLLFGNIHAGEIAAKEALLLLAREMARGDHPETLKSVITLIVPNFNADGNDDVSPENRSWQPGPSAGVGTRTNAQGLDLNRDWMKLESPECRAMVRAFWQWNPVMVVDGHTTNGTFHRYTITFDGPKHPSTDRGVLKVVNDIILPRAVKTVRERDGYEMFWYGNLDQGQQTWRGYPSMPRYGAPYLGLRNRMAVLSEAYVYDEYTDRVMGTLAFCRSLLESATDNASQFAELARRADEATARLWNTGGTVAIRTKIVSSNETATILARGETRNEAGRRVQTDEPVDVRDVEVHVSHEAALEAAVPWAYIVNNPSEGLADTIRAHGVAVAEIAGQTTVAGVQDFRTASFTTASREFQGHALITVEGEWAPEPKDATVAPGALLVRCDNHNAKVIVNLLDPRAEDGLTTWNAFGADTRVLRVAQPVEIDGVDAAQPSDAQPREYGQKKRISYEAVFESRRPPNLNGRPQRFVWDNESRLVSQRGGQRVTLDPLTGDEVEADADDDGLEDALRALDAINNRQASGIARQLRSRLSGREANAPGLLFEHSDDLFWYDVEDAEARRLTDTPDADEEVALADESGSVVGFVVDHDFYTVSTDGGPVTRHTNAGSETRRFGKHTWVYFEELYGRSWRAFWPSPDGEHIALLETDDSMVPRFTIVDDNRDPQVVEVTAYPRVGDANPEVELWVINIATGRKRQIDFSAGFHPTSLVSAVDWRPDGERLIVTRHNRMQSGFERFEIDPGSGRVVDNRWTKVEDGWLPAPRGVTYLRDGSYLVLTELFGGYTSLDRIGPSIYDTLTPNTNREEWDVRSIAHVDEDRGVVLFTATKDSPIANNLYSVPLDGGPITRLTPEDGNHSTSVSPDGRYFVDSYSSFFQPTKVNLRSAHDGSLIRVLDDNPVDDLDEWAVSPIEPVRVPVPDEDYVLEGYLIKPYDFDATKQYPVWMMTYAGPQAPTVRNTWGGGRLWEQVLADAGIIVFRVDPYAASNKGIASAWTQYRQMGLPQARDLDVAARWIGAKPWADASRIGLSGHSFGGYITAFTMTQTDAFAAGIAGAPVTDWRLYDTIYTERYMGLLEDNEEGYDATSAIKHAAKLSGRLLLAHGAIDDNVHLENTLDLAAAFQRANVDFEMMIYPGSRHGIRPRHYRNLQFNFIIDTMKPER